jgi:NADPH:quinone reductase-like Zn-dependent oxidoreductase
MRAVHIDRFNDFDGLVLRDDGDPPQPGPNEVLVRVRAVSLNYRDLMVLDGTYPWPGHLGVIPVSDGAGEVVAVGAGTERFTVGDRVANTYLQGYIDGPLTRAAASSQPGSTHDGMLAEYRVLHEDWLVRVPESISFAEAATLPCAGLTAWSALHGPRPVLAGESVLVVGSGGVGLLAVQLAQALGAQVLATASGGRKAEVLKDLGITQVLDHRTDWVDDLTGHLGGGADHVLDTVGPVTVERAIRSASAGGQISSIGTIAEGAVPIDPALFGPGRLFSLRRIAVGSRTQLEALVAFVAEHELHPVIDRTFRFEEAVDAYRYLAGRRHVGKVVITV